MTFGGTFADAFADTSSCGPGDEGVGERCAMGGITPSSTFIVSGREDCVALAGLGAVATGAALVSGGFSLVTGWLDWSLLGGAFPRARRMSLANCPAFFPFAGVVEMGSMVVPLDEFDGLAEGVD